MKKILAFVAMMVCVATAFGQGPGGMGMGPGPNHDMPDNDGPQGIFDTMNLTEDQQTQIEKLRIDMQKKQTALHAKIRIAELEIQELFDAPTIDRTAIEKKTKEISDLQLQLKMNMIDHQFAVKGILTPDQQKLWKRHMKSMAQGGPMRHQMMERMMDRRMDRDAGGPEDRVIERRIERKIEKDVK
jgi:Spy/CpxP family protein refolding chaperone